MGLNRLTAILEKRGSAFLEKFLNDDVVITEKLDTYRILFEKQGDKLVFFKKDNTPINLVERTLTNVWEDAIIELSTIIDGEKLPEGLRFGISYTPVERPIRIPYTNLPKYILTDVTLRNGNKVVEAFEYDEVEKWAATLSLARPPVIFKGKLNEKQRNTILNYGLKKYDEIEDSNNFSSIIKNLFGKTYSDQDIVEGIIIKSNKDLAQIVSYEFDILNEAYQKEKFSRDYYDIILINLNNFLDSYKLPVLESNSSDKMYLDLICDIFNKFCKKNPMILEDVKEDYLTPPSFGYFGDLNLLLINNKETLDILEKGGKIYEALFRVILSSFRKPKKEFGLLNESHTKKFNTFVYLIRNIINEAEEEQEEKSENLNEVLTTDLDVETLNEYLQDNVVIKTLDKRMLTDVDNMRVIASIQKAFNPSSPEIEKGLEKVAVYITEFEPFTVAQLDNIKSINRKWGLPVIVVSISNKKKVGGKKFRFSDDLVKAQILALASSEKDLVPSYFILDTLNLWEVFDNCRPKYEPMVVITDKDKKSEMAIQLYFEDKVMGGRIDVDPNFNIGDVDNKDKLQAFRSIEDNMFSDFKNYTPDFIWKFFENMKGEYKTWSGEVLPQFKENKFI